MLLLVTLLCGLISGRCEVDNSSPMSSYLLLWDMAVMHVGRLQLWPLTAALSRPSSRMMMC